MVMSAPIQRDDSFDDARFYAPPWARGQQPEAPDRADAATSPPVAPASDPADWAPPPARPSSFAGDRAMTQLRRRMSLEPEVAPEPPCELPRRRLLPWPVRVVLVLIAMGAAAYGVHPRLIGSDPTAAPADGESNSPPWTLAAAGSRPELPAPAAASLVVEARQAFEDEPLAVEVEGLAKPGVAPAPSEPRSARAERPRPEPAPPPADPEETAMLVKRGFEFLKSGDITAARLVLRRAAETGHAEAALALGASYDPGILAGLGAVSVAADVAQARVWYQRALELGSQEASHRIEQLALAQER
jgi:hypothetical protein